MSLPVAVNGLVPLCYLSPNKLTNLFIRVRIFDEADVLLSTKDLVHIEDGRYTDASFFMPDKPSIKVRYDVYEDAGYSAPSEEEGSIDERFSRIDTATALIRNDELIITLEEQSESMFITFIENDVISVHFSEGSEGIAAVFSENDTIAATFDEEDDKITIEFHDC